VRRKGEESWLTVEEGEGDRGDYDFALPITVFSNEMR
jgi:hypothetical protein